MELLIKLAISLPLIVSVSFVLIRGYACYIADSKAKCSDSCKCTNDTKQVEETKPKRGRKKKS